MERDRVVLDDPPSGHDVGERVAVIEKADGRSCGDRIGP
jgi:hypothetical protein